MNPEQPIKPTSHFKNKQERFEAIAREHLRGFMISESASFMIQEIRDCWQELSKSNARIRELEDKLDVISTNAFEDDNARLDEIRKLKSQLAEALESMKKIASHRHEDFSCCRDEAKDFLSSHEKGRP